MVMTRRLVLFAGTASIAACTVQYVPEPSAATVGFVPVPVTALKDHCIRATSEHVSSTIGLLPAVEPSLSLTHSPVATDCTRYFPDAAAEAVNVHNWLVFVPSPQPYC